MLLSIHAPFSVIYMGMLWYFIFM